MINSKTDSTIVQTSFLPCNCELIFERAKSEAVETCKNSTSSTHDSNLLVHNEEVSLSALHSCDSCSTASQSLRVILGLFSLDLCTFSPSSTPPRLFPSSSEVLFRHPNNHDACHNHRRRRREKVRHPSHTPCLETSNTKQKAQLLR
jgi:hypothetical protein